jgi:ferritin-like metal-binding protein YciE
MHHTHQSTLENNVSGGERLASALAGVGLTLLAGRRGGLLMRLATSTAAASLLARAATSYCPMKAVTTGQAPVGDAYRELWQRVRAKAGTGVGTIDSMESLYLAELQELHSAEAQLSDLAADVSGSISDATLQLAVRTYGEELRSRQTELQQVIGREGADPRRHPDQAMHALVSEARKMAHVAAPAVRDAGLVASLQRIVHYKIAGYGTVAAYANALGREAEAARFAGWVDRDREIDEELSRFAKSTLNPRAQSTGTGAPRSYS